MVNAIRGRDFNKVRMLLSSVTNLDAAGAPLPPMTPPLVEAAAAGDCDILNLLLERSPSLDVRDVGLGVCSLPSLCEHGHTSASDGKLGCTVLS